MIFNVINVIFIVTIPFVILRLHSSRLVSNLGTVGTAYIAGIIFSLIVSFFVPARDTSLSEILMYLSISIAIPLLLFSSSIKKVAQVSRIVLLSFLLLIVSVLLASCAFFYIFTRYFDYGDILSGMAVALYTGGTPNLNAVACFFRLDNTMILMANLSDIIFGGLFYVFLIFAAKPLLSKFLGNGKEPIQFTCSRTCDEIVQQHSSLLNAGALRNLAIAFAIMLVSLCAGLMVWLVNGKVDGTMVNYVVPALMIGTTIGGILFSLNNKINSVKENDIMGTYFVTVFSYTLASTIDVNKISGLQLHIFAVFAVITCEAFIIHALLCRIFKIGVNTMIITATAGIYGPAFIPSISRAIKADYLLASGLIIGSFGYAIGTFVGIACTYFLSLFM